MRMKSIHNINLELYDKHYKTLLSETDIQRNRYITWS